MQDNELIDKAIRASLWRRGVLTWKLRPHQMPIYEFIANGGDRTLRPKPAMKTLLNISRQTGKSYTAVLYAVEHCLRTKHAHVQCLASTGKQMRTILIPALKKILEDCPEDLQPVPLAMDNSWTFPSTGAVLRFDGVDNDNAENLRGRSSTFVIFDEAAFIDDLKYVVHDIIMPQFLVTKGRMVLISTPPETPDHYFKELCDVADTESAYLKRTVYENGFATAEDIELWKKEAGGEHTTTWKREYLCEFVVDTSRVVIPEFDEDRRKRLVADVPPAGPNHKFVGMDLGFKDGTGLVFGYYDFKSARAMIQAEILMFGKDVRTDFLANQIRNTEGRLWGIEPSFRVSDVDLILLNDLQSIHHIAFRPVGKENKEAMVNELRLWFQSERIVIDPSCKNLIRQVQNCIWNKRRDAFERDSTGHYDLVDALIYAIRSLPSVVPLNPYPSGGWNPATHYVRPGAQVDNDPDIKALDQIFGRHPRQDTEWVDFEEAI